jgi:hypothetical protein
LLLPSYYFSIPRPIIAGGFLYPAPQYPVYAQLQSVEYLRAVEAHLLE